ncbi:MAG TPA: M56 family metallopeptidase [Terriglobales bacterium]|nr:M56 family metallopeptidase [Terriglobales bacterium]
MTLWAGLLLNASVRSLLLAAMVLMLSACRRRQHPETRLRVWRAVLLVALVMPLLTALLPPARITLAVLPALPTPAPVSQPLPMTSDRRPVTAFRSSIPAIATPTVKLPAARQSDSRWYGCWQQAATTLYFLVALGLLLRVFLGWLAAVKLARQSCPIHAPELQLAAASAAWAVRLPRAPRLAESTAIVAPAAVGCLRPVILLPAQWRQWPLEKSRAVLVHEMAHVARADGLTQFLSLLHRSVFWFSPLSWWLHQHLLGLAEEASDAAALRTGADQTGYAAWLLEFLRDVRAASRRQPQALAMARECSAERRITAILHWKKETIMNPATSRFNWTLIAALLPLSCILAAARPGVARHSAPPPAPRPAPSATTAPNPTPAPPPGLAPPVSRPAPQERAASSSATYTFVESGPNQSFINDSREDNGCDSTMMNNETRTIQISFNCVPSIPDRDVRFKATISPTEIDFVSNGSHYRVTDAATVAQARSLLEPILSLSQQQAQLGRQQSELGRQQSELGRQQSDRGRAQSEAAAPVDKTELLAQVADLQREISALRDTATQSELGHLQSEAGRLQSSLGRLQSAASQTQSELGQQQSELGRQQSQLGQQQSELGRQQSQLGREEQIKADEAERQLHAIFDNARSRGLAH